VYGQVTGVGKSAAYDMIRLYELIIQADCKVLTDLANESVLRSQMLTKFPRNQSKGNSSDVISHLQGLRSDTVVATYFSEQSCLRAEGNLDPPPYETSSQPPNTDNVSNETANQELVPGKVAEILTNGVNSNPVRFSGSSLFERKSCHRYLCSL
jgi:hypothetical protein